VATGPTNQQGPVPQPGSTTPVGQEIGPLPADTATGTVAQVIPTWANFHFLLDAINKLQAEIDAIVINPVTGGSVVEVDTALPITGGPITTTGTVGHATSGVAPGQYGDATHVSQITVNATGHVTAALNVPFSAGGAVSITATTPIVVTPSPITGTGVVSHAASGVTPGTYGDTSHFAIVTVETDGHVTSASQQVFPVSGVLQSQEFTSSGTFNVPAGLTSIWLTMIGGGGGGGTTIVAGNGGGGGGTGEIVQQDPIPCTASGTITVTIGAAGAGGASGQVTAQPGQNGGDTSITSNGVQYFARGGKGATAGAIGGAGGGIRGGAGGTTGGFGAFGAQESPTYFGGVGGGSGGALAANPGIAGTGNAGYPTGSANGISVASQAGGGGGSNSQWGIGGVGGNGGSAGGNAPSTSYGSGGGGSGGHATTTLGGGNGAPGYVLIQWVA
jgi:Glycine-rich domain